MWQPPPGRLQPVNFLWLFLLKSAPACHNGAAHSWCKTRFPEKCGNHNRVAHWKTATSHCSPREPLPKHTTGRATAATEIHPANLQEFPKDNPFDCRRKQSLQSTVSTGLRSLDDHPNRQPQVVRHTARLSVRPPTSMKCVLGRSDAASGVRRTAPKLAASDSACAALAAEMARLAASSAIWRIRFSKRAGTVRKLPSHEGTARNEPVA